MPVLKSQKPKIDYFLLFLVMGLTLFGILMVYDASVVTAFRDFGDKFFYARQQMVSVFLGLLMLGIFARIDYRHFGKLTVPLLLLTIFFLVIVLLPGIGISALGAKRWLGFGQINFQPAELAKLSLVLYFASFLAKKRKLLPFLGILGLIIFLVMLEPDLGTSVVLLISSLAIYFASGAPLFSLFLLGIVSFLGGMSLILSSAYRRERLLTFLDLGRDPLGASYHIRQVLLALGSGGLFGLGLGASRQKYEYLPESMTDSIFAVIGEEMGFIGAGVLISAFLLVIWRGFKIAKEAPDQFGQLLAVGITSWIAIQTLVNLASMVALVPLTGIPLPFISFGGSSLVASLAGMGILLNISKYRVKVRTK